MSARGVPEVVVDYDMCEANGVCEAIAPEVFELDDDEQLHIKAQPDSDTEQRVRQAVASCPKVALSLRE
ncbi:ferredoxin [Saccharomonospora marina XMU15]|uniref:Ferredoxin n=1 Tax=Saccharomonospora marina XMU15 TaxID=882083 RepID=H5XA01_9PSEU|nr:ferredoxin [Saccharomonospora marina]EHR53661.1 ferredoxin [Saccharomonospora marina XMU15]